jgi:hypothetical protein
MDRKSKDLKKTGARQPQASDPVHLNVSQTAERSAVDMIVEESSPRNLSGLDWLAVNRHYISGDDLATGIEANPGQPVPDGLRNYLCRFLRGKVTRKRGPKESEKEFRFLIEFLAARDYHIELQRLQQEGNPRGREAIGQDVLSPHDEAIRIVKERYRGRFGPVSPARVANILSSH